MPELPSVGNPPHAKRGVIAYVDGLNLHFGLMSQGMRRHMWVDPVALAQTLLHPEQRLERVKLFTSRIPGARPGDDSRAARRREVARKIQDTYLDALAARDRLEIHFGHFLCKQRRCEACGAQWAQPEEKKTDVLIACHLLMDAADETCDQIMLVSGDGDLSPPLRIIRQRLPGVRIIVAFPPRRRSVELQRHAHAYFQIGVAKIRRSQLPPVVVTPSGIRLERPPEWR